MQLTDWLVVIFIVAIVVVLVDGVRRKLSERHNRVVLKLDRNIPQDVDPDEFPISELPNGGARAIPREGQPAPSLRTLQAKRKLAFRSARIAEDPGVRAVPVLLDTVDVEEERIEHTNVFADPHAAASFQADDFAADDGPEFREASATSRKEPAFAERAPKDDADEFIDALDEEFEEDAMLAEPEVARKEPGYMETRYQGRRDEDDEDDYEDEEEEEDDEEEDDDLEEFDDDLDEDEDDEDDEDDDDLDEDDDDDLDDDEEDDDDFDDDEEEDDDEDEDDEDDEEEDLDELEGLPEDEWGAEEEQDVLVDDYENEPMPLQGAFDKAASQIDKVASQAASQFDKVASQAANQFDRVASHAASQFDRAATQAANHFNRPARQDASRIEPGFGDDGADTASFDDTNFSEDFSGAWDEAADAAETAESFVPRPGDARADKRGAAAPKAVSGKRDQGELFAAPKGQPREESRLMAALQKAVPRGTQPEQAAAPVAAVPQEVIIINVMARPGHVLHGAELLSVLQAQGLRLGDMSIFHRHADNHGTGPTMFSMANMVKPGTFDLATIDSFTTPGVSFFLQMPNKLGNMNCFDKMLGAASAVRDAFDAELKDEHRSVFTRQTVEHCRQRVRDFELKLLSRK